MPDQRDPLMTDSAEESQRRHRVHQAFAEFVGRTIVEPRDRDVIARHLQTKPWIQHRGTVVTADSAADAKRRAAFLGRAMEHDRNRAARGQQSNLAGAGYFFARLDASNAESYSFVQDLTVTGSGALITRVAEHPPPIASHRD